MKKGKIFPLLLVLCLMAGCGGKENTAQLKQLENITPVGEFTTTEETGTKRAEYIRTITSSDMLSENRLTMLEKAGITVRATQLTENEDDTLNINLVLENSDGRILNLPLTVMLDYNTYGDGFHAPRLYWGNINVADSGLILTTLNHVYFIDTDTMKLTEAEFDLSVLDNGYYYLGDTLKYDGGYITCYYTGENKNGLLFFTSDSSLRKNVESEYFFMGRDASYSSSTEPYTMDIDEKYDIMLLDKTGLYIAGKSNDADGGYAYIGDKQEFVYYDTAFDVDISTGKISLYKFTHPKEGNSLAFIATRYDDKGNVTDSFRTAMSLHTAFGNKYFLNSENLTLEVTEAADGIYTVYDPYTAQQVELNYTDNTSAAEYVYDGRWHYNEKELSKDGRFAIVTGSWHGGGDISYEANVLLEKATGKMKYIEETGGMYGGDNETGFLQNGDVYFYGYDDFKIFDTDMDNLSPIWQLTHCFPMGETVREGVRYRYLMAARRDPQDKSVSIVYFDYPECDEGRYAYVDNDSNSWQLKATYHFARITESGKVEFDYDTGVHALLNYNLIPVSIYPEANGNMHIYGWSDSHQYIWFEGSINPATGQYMPIKDFEKP